MPRITASIGKSRGIGLQDSLPFPAVKMSLRGIGNDIKAACSCRLAAERRASDLADGRIAAVRQGSAIIGLPTYSRKSLTIRRTGTQEAER
jgi:hypothetical protein